MITISSPKRPINAIDFHVVLERALQELARVKYTMEPIPDEKPIFRVTMPWGYFDFKEHTTRTYKTYQEFEQVNGKYRPKYHFQSLVAERVAQLLGCSLRESGGPRPR